MELEFILTKIPCSLNLLLSARYEHSFTISNDLSYSWRICLATRHDHWIGGIELGRSFADFGRSAIDQVCHSNWF